MSEHENPFPTPDLGAPATSAPNEPPQPYEVPDDPGDDITGEDGQVIARDQRKLHQDQDFQTPQYNAAPAGGQLANPVRAS